MEGAMSLLLDVRLKKRNLKNLLSMKKMDGKKSQWKWCN